MRAESGGPAGISKVFHGFSQRFSNDFQFSQRFSSSFQSVSSILRLILRSFETFSEDLELFELSLQGRSWSEAQGALEEAVEASVEATARAWRQARAEAQSACASQEETEVKRRKEKKEKETIKIIILNSYVISI